ncbi:hypothetical protein L6452_17931 [Arctium lappa]|uniref:Uncharacterized protein n=1 Tax=Arctium lappa TaxID=4217 RepID=A0ACB9C4T1_ARCLA|nr:hypothetical protein L6452_17931 [Arctium lappa]
MNMGGRYGFFSLIFPLFPEQCWWWDGMLETVGHVVVLFLLKTTGLDAAASRQAGRLSMCYPTSYNKKIL